MSRYKPKRRKPRELETHGRPPPAYTREGNLPSAAATQQRRVHAYNLKFQGITLREIGRRLHADPAINSEGQHFPGGYGWKNYRYGKPPVDGDDLINAVSKDLGPGLRRARIAHETIRAEGVAFYLERLERAAAALWPQVMEGHPRSHEMWLSNINTQLDLLGLKQGDTLDVNVTVEGPQPKIDLGYMEKYMGALAEVGAVEATTNDAFLQQLDARRERERDAIEAGEVIEDAEVIETPEPEPTTE